MAMSTSGDVNIILGNASEEMMCEESGGGVHQLGASSEGYNLGKTAALHTRGYDSIRYATTTLD